MTLPGAADAAGRHAGDGGRVRAYVGLGANLGDARGAVRGAIDALDRLPGTRVVARSSLWRSAPVDAQGPDFVNAVVALDTTLAAEALLAALQALEHAQGANGRIGMRRARSTWTCCYGAIASRPRRR